MFLLDTNVISQLTKLQPHAVLDWVLSQSEKDLYLCSATLIEIRYGIEKKAHGRKRDELERWLTQTLPARFEGRIVPIEQHAADLAGRLMYRSEHERWGMDEMDAIIAACAMVNDLSLVTLNRKHFDKAGLALVDF